MASFTMIISVILLLSLVNQIKSFNCGDSYSKIESSKPNALIIQNVTSSEEFSCICDKIRYNDKRKWDFRNFHLEDGLPRRAFVDSKIETLILRDFFLRDLSDSLQQWSPPFLGLEETLKELIIINPLKGVNWKWGELSALNKIERIIISHGSFSNADHSSRLDPDEFQKLNGKSVIWLQITGGCMKELEENLLSSFTSLKYLHLQSNKLLGFKRNVLPQTLEHLEYIDLSNNQIRKLDDKAFQNMPALKMVSLENNQLTSFIKTPYSPLLKQKSKIYLYGNNILCDNKIKWMIKDIDLLEDEERPLVCGGEPDAKLRGMIIRKLTPEDLKSTVKKTSSPVLMIPADYLPLHVCEFSSWLNYSVKG